LHKQNIVLTFALAKQSFDIRKSVFNTLYTVHLKLSLTEGVGFEKIWDEKQQIKIKMQKRVRIYQKIAVRVV
jgi:hypothetical protein